MEFTLNTGAKMPALGLGTWKVPEAEVEKAVTSALEVGYRHIDGAAIYKNEKGVGAAYKSIFGSGKVKREDVFITSKLWNTEHKAERVVPACKATLADLNLGYLDLYLMHWGIAIPPFNAPPTNPSGRWTEQLDEKGNLITEKISVRETWEAMQELVTLGLVRAIGVSNFTVPMLVDLHTYATVRPAVNQIELHPYLQQQRVVEFCQRFGIVVTAYSPLASPGNYKSRGFPILIDDPVVTGIASRVGKSPAQVVLRWAVERGTVPIPKSTHPERMKENLGALDFSLSPEDMRTLGTLDRHLRFVDPHDWWRIAYFG